MERPTTALERQSCQKQGFDASSETQAQNVRGFTPNRRTLPSSPAVSHSGYLSIFSHLHSTLASVRNLHVHMYFNAPEG